MLSTQILARLSIFLALPLGGCAHFLGAHELEIPSTNCMKFSEPNDVLCSGADGKIGFSVKAVAICQEHDPDRWMLVGPEGHGLTVIGGSCFALEKGLE